MNVIEDQARSIFLSAVERGPDQWPAFLDEACGEDGDLRARVDQLLHAHQAMGSIHGRAAGAPAAAQTQRAAERSEGEPGVRRGAAADGAGQADETGARRAGLDRDEGAGEGPRAALRIRQRVCRGCATLPERGAGAGMAAECELPAGGSAFGAGPASRAGPT